MDEARAEYLKSLAIREEIAASPEAVPKNAIDLGWCYCNLGQLELDCGSHEESLKWLDKAIEAGRPVFDAEPRDVSARTLLQYCYRGRAKARKHLNLEYESDWEQVFKLIPDDDNPRNRLFRAQMQGEAGRFEAMVPGVELLVTMATSADGWPVWTPVDWYDFACLFSKASSRTGDSRLLIVALAQILKEPRFG
jgi:tetratricopeptide (TPR) repeat protein